ncbi:MAG TPA: hypothetical protein VFI35_11290 [Actinomycetota bacterium]|nr:hypothetical protein [Actinomycetota bacterium]
MAGIHEDAALVVELAKLGAMNGLGEAVGKIFADDFDPDTAELNDPSVRIVLGWNETVATLVKNDLLSRDLVYDWLWVAGTWDRVGPAALRARQAAGVAVLYENFEALAAGQR